MLSIVPSNQFKRDLKLAKKRGMNLALLSAVVDTLASQQPLDAKYRDHNLTGNYRGFRECHIEPDWLLVYRAWGHRFESCTAHHEKPWNHNDSEVFSLLFLEAHIP